MTYEHCQQKVKKIVDSVSNVTYNVSVENNGCCIDHIIEREAKPMSEVKTQDIKLQTETREAIEFIELLKSLTNDEKNQVKGYITCLRSVKNIKTA